MPSFAWRTPTTRTPPLGSDPKSPLIMAVVGSCTVNRALSQNSELRKEAYRKAAAYERKASDEAHAVRNEALSRGEGEGR